MKPAILGSFLLVVGAGSALAQTTPEARPLPTARGAEIRIERPDISLFIRCGEGETAKACSETATQLLEKVQAMPMPDMRGRRGGEREERRQRERDRDRE